jgi:S1-C subfamily serine protease
LQFVHDANAAEALIKPCWSLWKRGRKMNIKIDTSLRCLYLTLVLLALAHSALGQASPAPTELSSEEVIARVAPSVAVILTGEGAGRLSGVGSGIVVRSDGIILTAYHLIKDAREVQVRLKTGEIYDRAELVAVDERRDVAALRIPATNSPALEVAPLEEARPGEPIFVVSNPSALTWSASAGILSAVRPVEEVSPTQSGYRVLQFTAPVSPGSSGGAVVDSKGRALGIVEFSKQGQALNFGIPLETVLGLAGGSEHTALPSGQYLQPPQTERPPSSASLAHENSADALRNARTIFVHSRTVWFTPAALEQELIRRREFHDWGIAVVQDRRLADLDIEVDRPLWTYTFTVVVHDARTSMLLSTESVIAASGDLAAPGLAEKIVKTIGAARSAAASAAKTN